MNPKVVVVFPKYDPNDGSHYPYWYQLFEEASKELDLKVVFESGRPHPNPPLKGEGINNGYLQRVQLKPFNLLERLLVLIWLRLQGYQHFYIHYSIWSLYLAKLVTLVFGGKTYLWDCEYYEQLPVNPWQRVAIRMSDILVTGHQKIADQYRKVLNLRNKPIEVVRNWVDKKEIRDRRQETGEIKNILFVHHLSTRKGSRELPTIMEKVLDKRQDVQFTIIGDGPDFIDIKVKIKNLKLEKYVNFKGKLNRQGIEEEWRKADMFIMPSRAEGFPRVILEAMKYEVPYVATDVGCVREITPASLHPYIIIPGNPDLFAKNIIELLTLPSGQKAKIKQQLSKQIESYTLEGAVDEFCQLFLR